MSFESPNYSVPSRDDILAAYQHRADDAKTSGEPDELTFDGERDLRQSFRRLLDPGIFRGVEKKTALTSVKTLLTISENILNHPDDPKFKQFKPTNAVIKKALVDVKGALEYAVEMGFRADVQNFQPYYVFNPRKTTELRVGAAILREALERESEKETRIARSKLQERAAVDLQKKQVKLAFEDDRKRKALHDKLERERRVVHEAEANQVSPLSPSRDVDASFSEKGERSGYSPTSEVDDNEE